MPDSGYSLHPKVLDDVADIMIFIARDDFEAALREIYSTFEMISLPGMNLGAIWRTSIPQLQGIRFVPLTRFKGRYLIFWVPTPEKPRILYVYQANRDINSSMAKDLRE